MCCRKDKFEKMVTKVLENHPPGSRILYLEFDEYLKTCLFDDVPPDQRVIHWGVSSISPPPASLTLPHVGWLTHPSSLALPLQCHLERVLKSLTLENDTDGTRGLESQMWLVSFVLALNAPAEDRIDALFRIFTNNGADDAMSVASYRKCVSTSCFDPASHHDT